MPDPVCVGQSVRFTVGQLSRRWDHTIQNVFLYWRFLHLLPTTHSNEKQGVLLINSNRARPHMSICPGKNKKVTCRKWSGHLYQKYETIADQAIN
ncbi:hypothetical protein AAKU67_001981 [Oxalobacteraceae bacterium GrIS 2.11]